MNTIIIDILKNREIRKKRTNEHKKQEKLTEESIEKFHKPIVKEVIKQKELIDTAIQKFKTPEIQQQPLPAIQQKQPLMLDLDKDINLNVLDKFKYDLPSKFLEIDDVDERHEQINLRIEDIDHYLKQLGGKKN